MSTSNLITELRKKGWIKKSIDEELLLSLGITRLREDCLRQFLNIISSHSLEIFKSIPSGQYGYTKNGNESTVGVSELRSHLLFNQALPSDHPMSFLSPHFYGDKANDNFIDPILSNFLLKVHKLNSALDTLTIGFFEELEISMGIPYGEISSKLAMGERLLRFHWYPPIVEPYNLKSIIVDFGNDHINVMGAAVRKLEGISSEIVHVSPHIDTGIWTWQVHATDNQFRYWDAFEKRKVEIQSDDHIYGNVCDFLALEFSSLHPPVHWVDMNTDSIEKGRASIAYFVHTRPSVLVSGKHSGVLLYEKLNDMGYCTSRERSMVEILLSDYKASDSEIVRKCIEWEKNNDIPKGFNIGVSKYYSLDDKSSTGIKRKIKPYR